jgi:NAD(P)-dependent dehydrogenase (short-subunit alcohol dehydrogenase family)
MAVRTALITGGAGFIGASLALELAARHPDWSDWTPRNGSREILADIFDWVHELELAPVLAR